MLKQAEPLLNNKSEFLRALLPERESACLQGRDLGSVRDLCPEPKQRLEERKIGAKRTSGSTTMKVRRGGRRRRRSNQLTTMESMLLHLLPQLIMIEKMIFQV